MSSTILVTGGTGLLGAQVVPILRRAGHTVRVLSQHDREPGDGVRYVAVDLMTGEGLDAALSGVPIVLHLAGGPKGDDVSTRNLVEAAQRAGSVEHLVLISVVGADAVPVGYFARKAAAEEIVAASGIPYTILRAAQFHELTLKTVRAMAKAPVLPAPGGIRWQPVASGDVAARLAELTLGAPAGRVSDLVGPRVYTLEELQRGYLAAMGKRRMRLPIRVPGKIGKAYRSGANLNLDAPAGSHTWEEFLTAQTAGA
ncbi:NAD-dependent epimerase/dehydratase family protein [Actinomadura soli]|uniref:NAD-dependent epimerase/dehydratase family protein n=1 Tax=Actinomadura soli TaxID=2508997 RepID=A0A5C4JDC1_9ACTN|nr:NAD(P)H-binding protein [Actinomadura soli]TMR01191.1 NAD-dependent epimerase/dehydratase family protein [Actinomadura soli]